MTRQSFRKGYGAFCRGVYLTFIHGSPLLVYVIGVYYTYTLFRYIEKDTTSITNAAFAIVASMAALSFSCARAIEKASGEKDRFVYAGERYFHASVLLLVASIIKYTLQSLHASEWVASHEWFVQGLRYTIGLFPGILFFWALSSAHTGLKVINQLLWSRFGRYTDWDDLL